MNETKPTEDPRAYVRELVDWEDVNGYVATDYVQEWCNSRFARIDARGDVWVTTDETGEYGWRVLEDAELIVFADWCRSMLG